MTSLKFREGTCDESDGYELWSNVTKLGQVASLRFRDGTCDEPDGSKRNQCRVDKSLTYL